MIVYFHAFLSPEVDFDLEKEELFVIVIPKGEERIEGQLYVTHKVR